MFSRLDFTKASVLVVGDLMLDKYYFGSVNRISPEAPVPVVKVSFFKYTLGGAGNVVNNIVNLNAKVYIAGIIGKDQNGKILRELLEKKKVDYYLLESGICQCRCRLKCYHSYSPSQMSFGFY